jgi:hypothetical protein
MQLIIKNEIKMFDMIMNNWLMGRKDKRIMMFLTNQPYGIFRWFKESTNLNVFIVIENGEEANMTLLWNSFEEITLVKFLVVVETIWTGLAG